MLFCFLTPVRVGPLCLIPFSRGFDMTLEVSALSVFQDCTLEIFEMPYSIDFIPISIKDVCMIIGMD